MKTITVILLLSFLNVHAQEASGIQFPLNKDSVTGLVTYQKVILADSQNATELYNRAMEWYAGIFKSSKAVIEYSDKEAGKIMGHGAFYETIKCLGILCGGDNSFTISTFFKDGRAKIILAGFKWQDEGYKLTPLNFDSPAKYWMTWYPKQKEVLANELDQDSKNLILSFEDAMQNKSSAEKW